MNLFRQVMHGLTPAEPPRPQYYRAGCPRGHVLRGERTEGYQALRCPTCGEGVFVLPRSPLPEPPELPRHIRTAPTAPARPGPSPEDAPITLVDPPPGVDILEVIESEFEQPEPEEEAGFEEESRPDPVIQPTPAAKRPRPAHAAVSTAPSPPRAVKGRGPAPAPELVEDEEEFEEEEDEEQESRGRRRRSRRHLVTFAALALLAITAITSRVYQQWLQGLPKVVEAGRTLGLDALDAGRFDEAKDLLAKAAYAARKLGGRVEGAEEVQQGADEAAIYADLLPETLETILDEVAGAPAEGRDALLARRYLGRSLILEGKVEADPSDAQGRVLDFIVVPRAGGQRLARISLTGLELAERAKKEPGQPILCGARLAGLERREGNEWRFRLQPASGVLLVHTLALDALGFSDAVAPLPDPAAAEPAP